MEALEPPVALVTSPGRRLVTLRIFFTTVRDGAIEIGSARAVGLISEIEGEIGRSVGPISRRFL